MKSSTAIFPGAGLFVAAGTIAALREIDIGQDYLVKKSQSKGKGNLTLSVNQAHLKGFVLLV